MPIPPAEKSLLSRSTAHQMHAHIADPAAHTAPARAAFLAKFLHDADPDEVLDPAERERRAKHLAAAHFSRMAYLSVSARRKAKDLLARAEAAEAEAAAADAGTVTRV